MAFIRRPPRDASIAAANRVTDFLPYGRQSISKEDVAAVAAALTDPLITQGPRVEQFEHSFAQATGARHAVAFSSGTAGLHGAASAAGLGAGDEVLTTPLSFVASSNCAVFVGAKPRFSDVDSASANLDTAAAVSSGAVVGAKACVVVSLAGLPADLGPLQALRADGLVVIEDGCHALGAKRAGAPLGDGSAADMTVFSMHPVKAITTGEGGVVTTGSDEYAERLREFRTHGIRRGGDERDALKGPWHYDVATLGFNYRITDFQCALGETQLSRLPEFIEQRNRVADAYRSALAGIDGISLPATPRDGDAHAYHLFVIRLDEGAERRRQVYEFLLEQGIGTQLHYIPIYRHSLYQQMGYTGAAAACPNAERYYEQALSLPMFPAMTEADVERVAVALRAAISVAIPKS